MERSSLSITETDRRAVAALLGRAPRGLEEVSVRNAAGEPSVIRVAPLVDDKPFPTLYWLVDREISYRIDQEEASGLIAQLQDQINADSSLQAQMAEDHRRYKARREAYMSEEERQRVKALGFGDVFEIKGIGGIADTSRIRCLHTWYAAHLVESNTVGRMLDDYWAGAAESN
ncbi:hypothetical protein BST95_13975 [Halioglobus japonicus]|uniref:DUF501 domain-containing protein n=1 Tax=Halioglobus japonicus TaxID=930805 RepID=A0AAP8SPK7_9GAMM|nr:hypothetical protein BST95_13975 [Halioglobus japonicus]PLW87782.1 DUF501 domain-containing protein [Halioglobus japonicus]